ncbi:Transmembrane protein [Schistosoma japonicum]|uniref:Transmembrane protein n=1 Tax=Schistosoma japonicum TaxID=6182 RepID=A0A4Z2DWI2_SCHJA|nr:Transmembrane protein [Schistosoma japonicum]
MYQKSTRKVKPLINVNSTEFLDNLPYQSIQSSLPDVITMAWSYYKSMNHKEQQSLILSQWIYCQSPTIQFIVNRPSWWFFTFDNCNEHKLNNIIENSMRSQQIYSRNKIAYRLTLKNGENNDLFHEHFSSQEFGKLEIDLIFFILLGGLFLVAILLLFRLYRGNLLHHTVILWYTSVGLRFMAQLIQLTVDVNFARTGYFNLFNTSLANLFYSISISSFYTSLLILGSGFTIVYQTIPHNHMITFLILSISYTVINVICQISMGLTHYEIGIFTRYHSKAGFIYLGLQGISCMAYLFICSYTCIKWSGKRIFFIRFMAISCIWFWTVPLWVLLTANYVYHWYIETLIRVFDELIHLTGFILMMIILRPDRTNLIFPYHTNTITIIGINKQNDDENRQHKLITEQSISNISSSISTTSPHVSNIHTKNITSQLDKNLMNNKKIPPKRPNPPRLFNLTGKPGDIPAPGSIITSGLSELNKSSIDSSKRPQTTPTLSSDDSHSPHIKPIDKASSTH